MARQEDGPSIKNAAGERIHVRHGLVQEEHRPGGGDHRRERDQLALAALEVASSVADGGFLEAGILLAGAMEQMDQLG